MRNVRRQQVKQNRKTRKLIYLTFGILLFIYLSVNMIVGENGFMRYLKLRSAKDRLIAETISIEKQNANIRNQTGSRGNESDIVEELAREYGMTKEGELIFKFKD